MLLSLIASTVARSIQQAQWLSDARWVGLAILLGTIFGGMLAASRFRGRFAFAYNTFLAIIFSAESVGRFFPFLELRLTAAGGNTVWLMHLRLLSLLERIGGWVQSILERQINLEDGWLLLFLVFLLWNTFAYLAWTLVRKKQVIAGLIPPGLILGLNIHLSDQSSARLIFFVALSVFLTVYMVYQRNHLDWIRRKVDHPDLRLEWGYSGFWLSFAITMLSITLPIFTTHKGWRAISDFINRIQIEPRRISSQGVEGSAPEGSSGEATARTPDVSTIGTPIDQGLETIMLVSLSDPPPPLPEVAGPRPPKHYWRSGVFGKYTGWGWEPVDLPQTADTLTFPSNPPRGRYALEQVFHILATHDDRLYAVNHPVAGNEEVQITLIASDDTLLFGDSSAYIVMSWATDVTAQELISAPLEYPAQIANSYLQLPASLPDRVRRLAARITTGAETTYEKTKRIESYLRNNYPYSLDVPPVPEGRDAVDYFLFDAPGGFCSYYASALVVMLRAEGIPARVVTGYAMGEYDPSEGVYRVRAEDSHAWVEVYFSGYGWVEFEPTPARSTFSRESTSQDTLRSTPDTARSKPTIFIQRRWLYLASLVLSLFVGIGLFKIIVDRVHFARRSPREKAQEQYKSIRRALSTLGFVAPSSTTPNEFLARFSSSLVRTPDLQATVTQSTSLYLKARFSILTVTSGEIKGIRTLWRRSFVQRHILRFKQFAFAFGKRFRSLAGIETPLERVK
ncbi:MAG: hypothetical protein GTO14_00840 [Anaerolineales bacterium]|nr:hypothetical protein [Anaerolineales bacterium]